MIKLLQPTYDDVFSYKHLFLSYKKCLKGVKWKTTVQKYNQSAISSVYLAYKSLKERKVKTGQFFHFTIMERGKVRDIKSVRIAERVIQRCFCDYCLVPILSSKFIYDNSACIKEKGMHFSIKRLIANYHRYNKIHNDFNGYVLQFDFHHFFDTIPHKELIAMVGNEIIDRDLGNIFAQLVNDFPTDKGLGLGSQISQISALYYPHSIDNVFANDNKLFAYARYMDDGYIMCKSKEKLQECKNKLYEITSVLKLELNDNKTRIYKMSCCMEFLKARIKLRNNGDITTKPNRKNITRNRRKLKKLKDMNSQGLIEYANIDMIFKTTYGNFQNFDAYKSKENYKQLYVNLFQGGNNNVVCCM